MDAGFRLPPMLCQLFVLIRRLDQLACLFVNVLSAAIVAIPTWMDLGYPFFIHRGLLLLAGARPADAMFGF